MATKVDPLQTQRPETCYVGMDGRTVTGTFQWLLEKSLSHPITTGNVLETFICGEEGFSHIAKDIEAAKESIDLVCWGFDPGMALVRGKSDPAKKDPHPWANGEPYGELLKRKAAENVKVRLLVWYSSRGSALQNSLVGYVVPYDKELGRTIIETWDEGWHTKNSRFKKSIPDKRQDYCIEWWRDATSGQIPNLEVRCRDGAIDKVKNSVEDEGPANQPSTVGGLGPWFDESGLIRRWATHHQKPILIDYNFAVLEPDENSKIVEAREPRLIPKDGEGPGHKAVGYIMGLNSVSDYWDTAEHLCDDPQREKAYDGRKGSPSDPIAKTNLGKVSRKPLRDYACRVQGSALVGVYLNFCKAWNRANLLPKLEAASNSKKNSTLSANLPEDLQPAALKKTGEKQLALRLQVLRTQPEEVYKYKEIDEDSEKSKNFDKSIKHAYFQASSMARSYLYLENQYFFYEEWARHLKANRVAFMEWVQQVAGKKSKDARLLHLFVVIPEPENPDMVPRTYDTLRSLGQADAMPNQHKFITEDSKKNVGEDEVFRKDVTKVAVNIKPPIISTGETPATSKEDEPEKGVLLQEGKSLGLKVLVVKLVTQGQILNTGKQEYRDIYIHSKLMLADDCFMTLGSANMNQRSMAADSEINIATDNIDHNRGLRQRVWEQLTGGGKDGTGGDGTQDEVSLAFKAWNTLADDNAEAIKVPTAINGFIVKFSDNRTSTDRVG
jgi:phosphatidylserine/phosphatidylglycerophosphate/cardiolipin synthase-like enzyme